MVRGGERRQAGNWDCMVIMCLVWARLSWVLTYWAINWLMEYMWWRTSVVSEEKVGGGEELAAKLLQVAEVKRC